MIYLATTESVMITVNAVERQKEQIDRSMLQQKPLCGAKDCDNEQSAAKHLARDGRSEIIPTGSRLIPKEQTS